MDAADLFITAISVMEIERGVALLAPNDAIRAAQISVWLDLLLTTAQILPLDADAARVLGRLQAIPALRNFLVTTPGARQIRSGADLAIAAIALRHAATVVTGNVGDFTLIGRYAAALDIVDPFRTPP